MKKNTLKNLAKIVITTAGISYLTYKSIGLKLFKTLFKKSDADYDVLENNYLLRFNKVKSVKIRSLDGLLLYALFIEVNQNNDYMIMVHDVFKNKSSLYDQVIHFSELGYNILLIDQRAAGESEGEYHSYGLKESFDLVEWISFIIKMNSNANIYLYGESIGAVTCLMALKNKLKNNVKAVIAVSSYSSLKDQIADILTKKYNIYKPIVIVKIFEKLTKDEFGYELKDFEVKNILDNNEIPLLIIQSKIDNEIAYENSLILYNHNKGYKKIYLLEDAKHDEYHLCADFYNNIDNFIKSTKTLE